MPDRLLRLLEESEKQHLEDAPSSITGVLGKLLERDQNVEYAYLCHPAVCYIGKIKSKGENEGNNFCGFRNIQMLVSYVLCAMVTNAVKFPNGIPTIWEIQNTIEEAWSLGFNESGRVQTGGIIGTRKHIGTPEVCAVHFDLQLLWGYCSASLDRCQ